MRMKAQRTCRIILIIPVCVDVCSCMYAYMYSNHSCVSIILIIRVSIWMLCKRSPAWVYICVCIYVCI